MVQNLGVLVQNQVIPSLFVKRHRSNGLDGERAPFLSGEIEPVNLLWQEAKFVLVDLGDDSVPTRFGVSVFVLRSMQSRRRTELECMRYPLLLL